jgi:uncharacterized protein (DUF433 family)
MSLSFEPIAVPLRVDEDGTVRMADSRVTLDTVIGAYRRGDTPEEIADGFPSVPAADIYATIAWYLQHREQVDAYLAQREQEAAAIRAVIEADPQYQALRERWRARKAQMEAERRAATGRG